MSKDLPMHLFRGAPSVRSWSKYKETIEDWCLCGIHRIPGGRRKDAPQATENAEEVTCVFCLDLMRV